MSPVSPLGPYKAPSTINVAEVGDSTIKLAGVAVLTTALVPASDSIMKSAILGCSPLDVGVNYDINVLIVARIADRRTRGGDKLELSEILLFLTAVAKRY